MSILLPQEQNDVIVPPKSVKITPGQDLNHRLYPQSISFPGIKRSYRC